MLGAASGMVAGLATITPASGFVSIPVGVLHRAGGGRGLLSRRHETQGARSATTIRWTCSACTASAASTGMLMLGFLASQKVNPALVGTFKVNGVTTAIAGGAHQFFNQLQAVLVTVALAAIATWVLLKRG